jgi:hypothetical protein
MVNKGDCIFIKNKRDIFHYKERFLHGVSTFVCTIGDNCCTLTSPVTFEGSRAAAHGGAEPPNPRQFFRETLEANYRRSTQKSPLYLSVQTKREAGITPLDSE